MNNGNNEFQQFFRLKPTRAAKVSEISEATGASSTAPEDRVNFHIGNPIQEKELSSAYLRAVLGLDIRDESLADDDPASFLQALGWSEADRPVIELYIALVKRSAPYLPRGGFVRTSPTPLVLAFSDWLQHQQESLTYELGKSTTQREIILSSGGIAESLRVFFHALSTYLAEMPARVLLFHAPLPAHLTLQRDLTFASLPDDEAKAIQQLRTILSEGEQRPTFIVLGALPGEETRRSLRSISQEYPLFFLEANDAPNHLSLARESRLIDRVIRFLTPAIFSPRWRDVAITFVAGNAEYLSLLETIHFQLKGTPSASEVELLTYLLQHPSRNAPEAPVRAPLPIDPPLEGAGISPGAESVLVRTSSRVEGTIAAMLREREKRIDEATAPLHQHVERTVARLQARKGIPSVDAFLGLDSAALLDQLQDNVDDPAWVATLQESFLRAFARHHPEYDVAHCTVVSGSSRTSLSLLGFHCGIREVIIPDLSWSYEHCFPSVSAIPLTEEFGIDADAMIAAVEKRLSDDPGWKTYGAVVINNPHNATGRVFAIPSVQRILTHALQRGVTVIDDLSYQNVAPSEDLPEIPTLRQLAAALVAQGQITREDASHLVTVHSLSKTDCLAGARLSVVEIRDAALEARFRPLIDTVKPNIGAYMLGYLFYRNSLEVARAYWRLRNRIFLDRMGALESALQKLPAERNPMAIRILAPTGSMYPLMIIENLPAGLSLEWVASGLARQGIGMVPLSTFARTEKGYDTARKVFRLTLGGTDGAEVLQKKTRRVLIDLNRLIAEESAHYSSRRFPVHRTLPVPEEERGRWMEIEQAILREVENPALHRGRDIEELFGDGKVRRTWNEQFLPDRLSVFRQRFMDRATILQELTSAARADNGKALAAVLEREFYKDDLPRREEAFRQRLFDRTVHPTQMYSIRSEIAFDALIQEGLRGQAFEPGRLPAAARALEAEFLGLNVAISSGDEADEIILDLDALIAAELFGDTQRADIPRPFLSFWGDWDGSNRPSGQGHRLAASAVQHNVERLSRLLRLLMAKDASVRIRPDLLADIERLPGKTRRFMKLLDEITALTHQLERRYRGILPFHAETGRLRRIGMRLHLARDPVTSLWYHNDRLERRMVDLRRQRREALEYYFGVNKKLRKELHALIPDIRRNIGDPRLSREAVMYRDLLQRFLITPRIHQNMITAQDPFAIDTTVFNINEINEIGARYGNPGMVLALQVSMSTRPEAIIELDRKLRARREHVLRDHPAIDLPPVWLVPLFEDLDAVRNLPAYINKLWEYCLQSRRINQETRDRFAEMIAEVFIAGSDLSQHIGQAAGAQLYLEAKYELLHWLAEHDLSQRVRLKLGSGEPMQRQGGYYSTASGALAFSQSKQSEVRFSHALRASARRSTLYATTPMLGVFEGGDLRTFQGAISERIRHLPVRDYAQLLYHLNVAQQTHRRHLTRASEEFADSRLTSTKRGEQAIERLTIGTREPALDGFLKIHTENFRQILYGRDEDVVGIHIISYFIARNTLPLRDRPTVRPGHAGKSEGNRILERIADMIPFSRYGSRLRAIAHNQAQTAVLGINQLTTGLFRALDTFSQQDIVEGDPETFLTDHILPHLPVYEILQSLRLYQDVDLTALRSIERAFPAGNSAFLALREDEDAMGKYIPLFQQELLRRHGIDVSEFFEGNRFIPSLLPALRPDLAVLLQPDLFNTDPERLRALAGGEIDPAWLQEIGRLLEAPDRLRAWRADAWALLERPVYQRVEAFVELAVALYGLAAKNHTAERSGPPRSQKISSTLGHFFRMSQADDEMREFLAASMEYLAMASEGMMDVPASIIRAMREVERIAAIEEQALPPVQQDRLRFHLLQIARLSGENG